MIKYEMLKQNDNLKIFKNNDEFYKFLINLLFIENDINDIDDCFRFSCDIHVYYDSFEHMRNTLKLNNIDDYIICYHEMNEKIFIYDKKRNNVLFVHYNDLFCNEFSLCSLNETNKCDVLQMILNCMLNE